MTKKATKRDLLIQQIVEEHIDMSTMDLIRRREVACAKERASESELLELTVKAHEARKRHAEILAEIEGLAVVIGRR